MSKIVLTHHSGPLQGACRDFEKDKILIGRGPDNDFIFDSGAIEMVSRHHAEITVQKGRFQLSDVSSTGTFVNGNRVSSVILKVFDILRFGPNGPDLQVHSLAVEGKATVVMPALPQDEVSMTPATPPSPDNSPAVPDVIEPAKGDSAEPQDSAPRYEAKPTIVRQAHPERPANLAAVKKGSFPGASLSRVKTPEKPEVSGRLTQSVYVLGGLLLLLFLIVLVRAWRFSNQVEALESRLLKLDSQLVLLLQKVNAVNTQGVENMMKAKTAEIDEKIRMMEARARETEQRFQSLMDRKSAEMNRKFELLGEAYPQIKRKMAEMEQRSNRR